MTPEQWDALEQRIDALLDSHAALREERRQLLLEKAELRQRLEAVVERIKRLELETDA